MFPWRGIMAYNQLAWWLKVEGFIKFHVIRWGMKAQVSRSEAESILEKNKSLRWWSSVDNDWGWSVGTGVVLRCCVTKLTGWFSGQWGLWQWRRGGGRNRGRKGLTLTISVKAMVNDDLILIVWCLLEVEARQLRKEHSGLLFTWISKWVRRWTYLNFFIHNTLNSPHINLWS